MRYLQPKMANASSISARHRAENDAYSGSRPQSQVMAVDIDEQRLSRVYDNLKRLGMKAEVKQGDGRFLSSGVAMSSSIVFCWMPLLRNRRYSPPSGYQMAAPGSISPS